MEFDKKDIKVIKQLLMQEEVRVMRRCYSEHNPNVIDEQNKDDKVVLLKKIIKNNENE